MEARQRVELTGTNGPCGLTPSLCGSGIRIQKTEIGFPGVCAIRFNPSLPSVRFRSATVRWSAACRPDIRHLSTDICSTPDDHSLLEPPLPIPNRTVKQQHADDSAQLARESRSLSGTHKAQRPGQHAGAFCVDAASGSATEQPKRARDSCSSPAGGKGSVTTGIPPVLRTIGLGALG